MKIGKLICNKFGHPLKDGDDKYEYTHLIIETYEDLNNYAKFYSDITAEKNINALFGFKSQNFRKSFSDYLQHEYLSSSPEIRLLAMKLNYKETRTSLVEYCEMSDGIMNQKLQGMLKGLQSDRMVRINNSGGYCYIDNTDNYEILIEPTDKQLSTFINTGKIEDHEYRINSRTVIIENDDKDDLESNFLSKLYKKVDRNNLQILDRFKLRTNGFKDEDFLKLFQDGIDRGLRNICFQTTGQDYHNLQKLYALYLKLVELNPATKINIYFHSHDYKTKKLFTHKNCICLS